MDVNLSLVSAPLNDFFTGGSRHLFSHFKIRLGFLQFPVTVFFAEYIFEDQMNLVPAIVFAINPRKLSYLVMKRILVENMRSIFILSR